jgi:hypothetical protein
VSAPTKTTTASPSQQPPKQSDTALADAATPSATAGMRAVTIAMDAAVSAPGDPPTTPLSDAGVAVIQPPATKPPGLPDDSLDGAVPQPDAATPSTMPASPTEWVLSAPRKVGLLVGREAKYPQAGLQVFGSDIGYTFEHSGKVLMLFGDTYARADSPCDTSTPHNDDMLATLPLQYRPGLPEFNAFTEPNAPTEFRKLQLIRDGESIVLDAFKVPVTGFSDGTHAYAMFQTQAPVRCDNGATCPGQAGVMCVQGVTTCKPAPVTAPVTCELLSVLCTGKDCKIDACVDTRSATYDGTARGNAASVLSTVDIARQRTPDDTTFDSVVAWKTNMFSHPAARTVTKFTGMRAGSDYSHGYGSLLIWGRAGMAAEQGREARLYFATQSLPFQDASDFKPQYYAGFDTQSGEPRWSDDPGKAEPLALDGQPGGSPHEELAFVGTTNVSWLGAPVNRWILMYGGDVADFMLADPQGTRSRPNAGSIVVRFAEHPWGPWTVGVPHLSPGSPTEVGTPYGPGGIMFHPSCKDAPNAPCARADAYSLNLLGMCIASSTDQGRLYAANTIDSYTRKNDRGGLDISWTVATWSPYTVVAFESSLIPK